jgi:hypothetical protein
MGIGGSFTLGVQRWVTGGKVSNDIQLGADLANELFKMGREVIFHGFHFCFYGEMNFVIDGGNIGTELPHFLLGLYEIRGQGIEAGFKVLAMGVDHDEGGNPKGVGGTT